MTAGKPPTSFGHHMLRGSIWMVAMRWGMRLIGLVSTVILARLLVPEDFGIVAMALLVLGLLETLGYTGVDLALLRGSRVSREYYDSAWTIKIVQGLLIATLLLVLAPLAANFFEEPRVTLVVRILAIYALLDSARNIGVVAFRQELDFAKEFRFNLYTKLANFALVVVFALVFRNYIALVIGMVSSAAATVLVSYVMHPYRPRLSLSKVGEIWGFSQWLLVSGIGGYANGKADQFIVGSLEGTSAIGSYHVANEVATMPTAELVYPIRRAFYPTLAKLADDPAAFRDAVRQTYGVFAAICCALGFGLAAVTPEFVLTVLGEQWRESIPLLRWLALFGTFRALSNVLGVPIMVLGHTRLLAFRTWAQMLVLLPVLYFATVNHGVEGAAVGRIAVVVLFLPVMVFALTRVCELRATEIYAELWRPLLAGALMAVIVARVPVEPLLNYGPVPVVALAAKVAAGVMSYPLLLVLLWLAAGRPDGAESRLLGQARSLADSVAR